jgi:hypothetical protein
MERPQTTLDRTSPPDKILTLADLDLGACVKKLSRRFARLQPRSFRRF